MDDIFENLPIDEDEVIEKAVYDLCQKNNMQNQYNRILMLVKNMRKLDLDSSNINEIDAIID